jgi:allantoinase
MSDGQRALCVQPHHRAPANQLAGGARVAFYVGLNVEHFLVDRPSTSLNADTASLVPDPLNYGWRDYGPRVGIWRTIQSLDRHRMRASVLLNSDVCARYPQIKGRPGTQLGLAGPRPQQLDAPDHHVARRGAQVPHRGRRHHRWRHRCAAPRLAGAGTTETFQTPALLAELGLSYVLDWTNDDQPYWLTVPGMLSVPYSVELNDLGLFGFKGVSGPEFVQIVKDQLE